MEAPEVIGTHDPDEPDLRAARNQIAQGVVGEAGADGCLDAGHVDARMVRKRARRSDALRERTQSACVLERIARRYQPPHPVEVEARHCNQAGRAMGFMRWIERAAEQADPQAGGVGRKANTGNLHCAQPA